MTTLKRLTLTAAFIAVAFLAARAFHTATAKPRILIGDVTYSPEQIEMSNCIAGGGKAYFVPDDTRKDGILSRYIGCNLYVIGTGP